MDVSIEDFKRCTHINLYIIACLQAEKALDELQVSQLSGEKSLIKRSEMIFEWIQTNQALYDIFLRVMEHKDQQHVSNLLKGVKTGPHIPLSSSRYNQLVSIKPKLMLTIRNDEEFLAKLRAKHAISEIDCQDITQGRQEYKRNWYLIEAILRRSEYAFDCFEQTLKETLQHNVASYLHEGHVVAVHVNTTHPETDEVISDLLNKTILSESKDDTSSEEKILAHINGYNIHPVAAKLGQSIVLVLYCKTIDDMITFTELFISGKLQSIVEVILNRLLSKSYPENTEQLKADLRLDDAEILEVEKFSGIEDWMPVELEKATIESKILQNVATQTELQFEVTEESSDDWMEKQGGSKELPTGPLCSSDSSGEEKTAYENVLDWMEKQGGSKELPTGPLCSSDSSGEEKTAYENVLDLQPPEASSEKKLPQKRSLYDWVREIFWKKKPKEPGHELHVDTSQVVGSKSHKTQALASGRERQWRRERRALYNDERCWKLERRRLYEDERYWQHEGRDLYEDEDFWEYEGSVIDEDELNSSSDETLYWSREERRASIQTLTSRITEEEKQFNRLLPAKAQSKQVELPEKQKSDPILVTEIKRKGILGVEKEISGMTILDGKLFVLSQRSSSVEVYDSMIFGFCCLLHLDGVVDPLDIVSCNNHKCLYILDYNEFFNPSNKIWRFDPNGTLTKKWPIRVDFGDSLSVTDESNVILVVHHKNKLNEYSPDGHLIREINLSSDSGIFYPWHAVKLTSGNFLVSHGFGVSDQHRVAIVDGDGKLKKSFGGNRGSAIGQMNIPFHFAVDADGFVLVADRFNGRIFLLDPDLQYMREIISKEKNGIRDPEKILLDESNGRILVADNKWNNGRILVFQFQLTVPKIT